MRKPPRLYLDTNIISRIAQDSNRDQVIESIRHRYRARIGLLVVVEVGCIRDRHDRCLRLDIARRVSGGTKTRPFDDPRSIMRRDIETFVRGKSELDPFIDKHDGSKLAVWEILKNPESITEAQSLALLKIKEHAEDWFHRVMEQMRPRIQGLRDDEGHAFAPGHLTGFLKTLRKKEAFLQEEIANIVATTPYAKEVAGRELDLLRSHNVWPFFLAAMGAGCYNRAFRANSFSARKHAGGVDTWQTVYFAFTDIFVTHDVAFRRLLKVVRRYSVIPHCPLIWSYQDLVIDLSR